MRQILRAVNRPKRSSILIPAGGASLNLLTGDQLLRDFREWLSPPDPSINQKSSRRVIYKGTTTWFTQGTFFKEWKSTGSLLWVNGKCTYILPSAPPWLISFPLSSGFGEDHTLVRLSTSTVILISYGDAYIINQFLNRSGHPRHSRSRFNLHGIFLL
jgi:hypothetical protein